MPRALWSELRERHHGLVDPLISPDRMSNPVESFLWTYYSFRPREVRRWHPGALIHLEDAPEYKNRRGYGEYGPNVGVSRNFLEQRKSAIDFIYDLLSKTAARPAFHGCFGMHEWAMVYQTEPEAIRHSKFSLRLGVETTNALVEELGLKCSHYDAFRFFTPPARPLNLIHPVREDQPLNEQPGCIHANMDLYKWAYKLAPILPSDFTFAALNLARELREIDMRASPYDLSELGYQAIKVESSEGRTEYVRYQKEFAQRAQKLRLEMVAYLRKVQQLMTNGNQ